MTHPRGNLPSPPQLHQLVTATETLPPSAQQLEPALQKRAEQSRAEHTGPVSPPWPAPSISTAFHPDSVDPGRKPPMRFYMGASPSQILCFQASACWRRNGSTDGGIPTDTSSPVLLHLGTKAAVPYAFEGGGFRQWMGAGAAEGNAYPWTSSLLGTGWRVFLRRMGDELDAVDNGRMPHEPV
ncbi:hypothetical protein BO86DRAFT_406519 [Aspergillus japonicus CBS 114.51]|uniref:Uncharacterized protein n=1 Tax=Aspergillus japonicus CBS 114.51 TaxID=1448312 RepID=A0A8T8XFQ3_ASPJA|nr:hypothetical protein BO86DRAFT_406519 [Aspergillus japonicus CBS 114.51]RAH86112.1 hypothetical protein BO86DRAFT_406519 [Aspergillus japonicus CBS 114.51]